jgi:ethanolamine utilization protein EutP (predicted NTPase)
MKVTEFFSTVFQTITAIGGIISIVAGVDLADENITTSILLLLFGVSLIFTCAELDNLRAKTKLEEFSKLLDKLIEEEKRNANNNSGKNCG